MDSLLDKFIRYLRFRKVIRYIPKDSVVCDIGCGENANFLKSIRASIKYGIGVDKDVRDHKNSKLELKKLKLSNKLPLNSGTCDVVTMLAVLEHLQNPQEILNESFRILKAGGKLILTTPTPLAKPILEFLAFKLHLINKKQISDHKNYFWPNDIKKMLVQAGFKEENFKTSFFEFFLNSLIIAQK